PLAPLLVVLRDYILAYYALEFLPFNGSLRVLNLPLGYIAIVGLSIPATAIRVEVNGPPLLALFPTSLQFCVVMLLVIVACSAFVTVARVPRLASSPAPSGRSARG
ncbi:hypothetical protein D6D20_09790, partial [Aureobasidium pullulans]